MNFAETLSQVRPAYEIPEDDLVGEVLIPALQFCEELRIGAGFFSSRCLGQIAPGLVSFLTDTSGTLQLMVSPELSEEDRLAISRGVAEPEAVLQEALSTLFEKALLSDSAIERHTAQTLSYLIASGRLDMRIALMEQGMYHKKIWLIRSGTDWLAVHGSGNATERGLLANGEQFSIDRAWLDGSQSEHRLNIFKERWDRQWRNENPLILTVPVGDALNVLRTHSFPQPPTIRDFWEAWQRDFDGGGDIPAPFKDKVAIFNGDREEGEASRLRTPEGLQWREGRFAHQGKAVDALMENGGGILAIATGGGKTRTALIAATAFQNSDEHLCVVILAPSRPLIKQWTQDVRDFGVEPMVFSGMPKQNRATTLERLSYTFTSSRPRTEVLLLTNALFSQKESGERSWMENLPESVRTILIADEVHNLGVKSFIDEPPEFFSQRIGLSATPIRQYDPDGTDALFDYFGGPPVFEFSLAEAIEAGCLVPYEYQLRAIHFNQDEMELYEDLTQQLVRAGFSVDDDGRTVGMTDRVARLLRDRRALVEQADGKIDALENELKRLGDSVNKTLIYTSAKPIVGGKSKQITAVNRMLQQLNIISHQYTAAETGGRNSRDLLERFGAGEYQVLTAMKVLDEGVDIPQTDTAFLLASSTVEREWVQRRGRILRRAPGKKTATLFDFIVLPPSLSSPASVSLLRSEIRRASAFAALSDNEFDREGPNQIISELESELWGSM